MVVSGHWTSPYLCIFGELRAKAQQTPDNGSSCAHLEDRGEDGGTRISPWGPRWPGRGQSCVLRPFLSPWVCFLWGEAKSHVGLISAKVCLSSLVPWANISSLMLSHWIHSRHSGWNIRKTVMYQKETEHCSNVNQPINQTRKTVAEQSVGAMYLFRLKACPGSSAILWRLYDLWISLAKCSWRWGLCWLQSDESLLVWQEAWDQGLHYRFL